MDLYSSSDLHRLSVEEFDTSALLSHAARQARQRKYNEFMIVDIDCHAQEGDAELLEYMEDEVIRQGAVSFLKTLGRSQASRAGGDQDMAGRVTRNKLRRIEKTAGKGGKRNIELTLRWMDAMGVDYTCMFPAHLLALGLHPQVEVEVALAKAYNRWLCERILAEEPRIKSMIYLPFNDPDEAYRCVLEFSDKPGVIGFLITGVRYSAVHDNAYMRTYRALEERGKPLAFHAAYNWQNRYFEQMNRFISVHALGFPYYSMLHMTNWIVNGLPERFPKLKILWIEGGVAWVPFLMQRLDNEYLMRSSEAPLLKRMPSEYMQEMYYATQPLEKDTTRHRKLMEASFEAIHAETQLLFSTDYPHWDFDLPSTIYDLPFLSDATKRAILGGNAARLFRLEPWKRDKMGNPVYAG